MNADAGDISPGRTKESVPLLFNSSFFFFCAVLTVEDLEEIGRVHLDGDVGAVGRLSLPHGPGTVLKVHEELALFCGGGGGKQTYIVNGNSGSRASSKNEKKNPSHPSQTHPPRQTRRPTGPA